MADDGHTDFGAALAAIEADEARHYQNHALAVMRNLISGALCPCCHTPVNESDCGYADKASNADGLPALKTLLAEALCSECGDALGDGEIEQNDEGHTVHAGCVGKSESEDG